MNKKQELLLNHGLIESYLVHKRTKNINNKSRSLINDAPNGPKVPAKHPARVPRLCLDKPKFRSSLFKCTRREDTAPRLYSWIQLRVHVGASTISIKIL